MIATTFVFFLFTLSFLAFFLFLVRHTFLFSFAIANPFGTSSVRDDDKDNNNQRR